AFAIEALEIARETEESTVFVGLATWLVGWIALAEGDSDHAQRTLSDAVSLARMPEAPRFAALPLVTLAEAELWGDAPEHARHSLEDGLSLARSAAFTWVVGRGILVRARLRAAEGEPHDAEKMVHEAIRFQQDAGDLVGLVDAMELLAGLAAAEDSFKEAVRLWGAADAQRSELGYARYPVARPAYEASIARATAALGADAF